MSRDWSPMTVRYFGFCSTRHQRALTPGPPWTLSAELPQVGCRWYPLTTGWRDKVKKKKDSCLKTFYHERDDKAWTRHMISFLEICGKLKWRQTLHGHFICFFGLALLKKKNDKLSGHLSFPPTFLCIRTTCCPFGYNWIKKNSEEVRPIWPPEEFLESSISKFDKHIIVLFLNNYIAG